MMGLPIRHEHSLKTFRNLNIHLWLLIYYSCEAYNPFYEFFMDPSVSMEIHKIKALIYLSTKASELQYHTLWVVRLHKKRILEVGRYSLLSLFSR